MLLLKIALHGPLLIAGGQASALGVDLATAQRFDGENFVPYLPATAVRGAVRIQLEALLAGAEEPFTRPYILEETGTQASDHQDVVARLFGFSGPKGARNGAKPGCLRFGDALPLDSERARHALQVRPGLEIEDYTATAAEQKLFFREVAEASADPLIFEAELDTGDVDDQDLKYLKAAIETTDAIGAGKAKGGGFVTIEWSEEEPSLSPKIEGDPATATRAELIFTLQEPAHFGDGGPQGNHQGTRSYIPGATVRGAIAWALLRNKVVEPSEAGFQRLFVQPAARFGDALPVSKPGEEPVVSPVTARQRRGGRKEIHDVLLTELARDRVNALLAGTGVYLRADDGSARFDPVPARPAHDLVRRTRTRVSIDRVTGTAADGRLFSIEQIEPWLVKEEDEDIPRPARFSCWVEGLDPSGAALLEKAAHLRIFLGAGRNHGMGRAEVEIRFAGDPDLGGAEAQVLAFGAAIDREAARLAQRAGLAGSPPAGGQVPVVPVVLVAVSDFVPSASSARHPLAEPGLADLGPHPDLVRRFLSTAATGGYDQRDKGNLKDLVPAIGAGSVFVYEIAAGALAGWLRQTLPRLRLGVGSHVESGCGRFTLFAQRSGE